MSTKALKITNVRPVFNGKNATTGKPVNPIVIFDVQGHPSIVRNPRQALIDLQNSGRALSLNVDDFSNGIERVNPFVRGIFQKALLRCKGAIIEGDFTVTKAGDKYYPQDNHPVFTDKNHPQFGTIKTGEPLIAEKDGVWVNGFCTIPETNDELDREANAEAYANARVSMLGMSMAVPTAVEETLPSAEDVATQATASEAFAETPATKTK